MSKSLKQSINSALLWLVFAYTVLLMIGLSVALNASSMYHRSLAEMSARSVRNGIITRDLREVISILDSAIGKQFDGVELRGPDGVAIFSLPNTTTADRLRGAFLEAPIEINLATASHDLTGAGDLGKLTFVYSREATIELALGIWLLLAMIAAPIFARIKRYLIERHREALAVREAQVLTQVAQQVSHDIRSPLTALNIVGAAMSKLSTPEQNQLFANAVARINDIANDILVRSRTGSAAAQADDEESVNAPSELFDIKPLIAEIVSEKSLLIKSRPEISLELDNLAENSARVRISRVELMRVLSNLINNSIESISASGAIRVALRQQKDMVNIVVHDTGCGIPQELLARLGERGLTVGKAGKGNGFGLHHAKNTIDRSGGRLHIQSRVGQGTMITVSLPLAVS